MLSEMLIDGHSNMYSAPSEKNTEDDLNEEEDPNVKKENEG